MLGQVCGRTREEVALALVDSQIYDYVAANPPIDKHQVGRSPDGPLPPLGKAPFNSDWAMQLFIMMVNILICKFPASTS